MQDRFRFRIWDKFCETWLTDFAINQDGEINKFFNSEEALKRRFVLMQCTGLKDKNGKLIYEGDLVKNWDNLIYQIFWQEDAACYLVESIRSKNKLGIYSLISYQNNLEVIGNIYENPELLEVK